MKQRPACLRFLALLAALALASAGWATPQADRDEALAKFKKFIGNPNPDSRAAVIGSLAAVDCAEAVEVLLPSLGDDAWEVRAATLKVLSGYRSDEAVTALEGAVVARRTGRIRALGVLALGNIGRPGSVQALLACAADGDWEVRRAAAEALRAYPGDPGASVALRTLLQDKEETIRTTAADSLAKTKDREAIPELLAALDDPLWQVQAAAIDALEAIRDPRAIGPLITVMRRSGRLQEDAQNALETITTMKFGLDADRWETWWARNQEGFQPPEANPKKPAPGPGAVRPGGAAPEGPKIPGRVGPNLPGGAGERYAKKFTRYYGIPTPSEKILFLLDVSRSMAEVIEIEKPERLGDRKFSSNVKMEIAKEELTRTIDDLGSNVYFNILVYHTDVDEWKKGLQPATDGNKTSAKAFIARQTARGLQSGTTRSRGRTGIGASKLEEGRTNIFDALARAFAISGVGTYDRHYGTAVDTIFLLSDGEPTAGTLTKPHEIRAEISRLNQLRRVVIHTINFGKSPTGAGLLRQLAEDNGGTYVDLVGEIPFAGK